jgi:alpha,alpha-trehalase
MNAVLWSDAHGTWKDYWWRERRHSDIASVSDYSPLWARAFDPIQDKGRVVKVVASLASSGLVLQAGAQSTRRATGQQWDAPNAWPPEQDRLVEGLLATQLPEAEALAKQLVEAWVATGYAAWTRTGQMFEKYNASELGDIGSGGEYVPQLGFGWSNGVLLRFLTEYEHLIDVDAALALAASVHGS